MGEGDSTCKPASLGSWITTESNVEPIIYHALREAFMVLPRSWYCGGFRTGTGFRDGARFHI